MNAERCSDWCVGYDLVLKLVTGEVRRPFSALSARSDAAAALRPAWAGAGL